LQQFYLFPHGVFADGTTGYQDNKKESNK